MRAYSAHSANSVTAKCIIKVEVCCVFETEARPFSRVRSIIWSVKKPRKRICSARDATAFASVDGKRKTSSFDAKNAFKRDVARDATRNFEIETNSGYFQVKFPLNTDACFRAGRWIPPPRCRSIFQLDARKLLCARA